MLRPSRTTARRSAWWASPNGAAIAFDQGAAGEVSHAEGDRVAQAVAEGDIALPAPAFAPQTPVVVPKYGRGLVTAVAADRVSIVFPDGQTREFLQQFVRPAGVEVGERDLPAS